jgi:hypothetical protein
LATQDGRFLELVIPAVPAQDTETAYLITPDSAASFGIDFSAWSAAAIDPADNRSIVTFGGMRQEQPFNNPWHPFVLDRIDVFVVGFFPEREETAGIRVSLVDFIPVPEPSSSALLVVMCLTVGSVELRLFARRTSR